MKRVLLLIPALNAGGAERVMVTLANEWSKTADVTLMVFNDGRCFYTLSERVHLTCMNLMPEKKGIARLMSIPGTEIKRFLEINKEIRTGGYDFVLSFCYTTNMFASISAMLNKEKRVLISERNDPYGYSKPIRFLINRLYRKCDTVICQNQMVKNYFETQKFKNKLTILPNPVNFADIPGERPKEIRKTIVNVGRLIEQKNQILLIDAFSEISSRFKEYNLVIYGIGPLEGALRKRIQELKLEDRVELLGTKKKVMFEVNNCSIFVLSSNFEGFPNVLIEAMATGLPVISSDFPTGIAKELIRNENNGYLFKVNDKEQLVESLEKLLSREKEFLLIGENNRNVATGYRDEVISNKWLQSIL